MTGQGKVPDAWDDDDWVKKADVEPVEEPAPLPPKKLSKAERRAQQAEFNRQLWADAEAPAAPYYVESRYDTPLQSAFKPNVTLLARKPAQAMIARKDPVTGLERLTIEDEDDDEDAQPAQLTAEERMQQAQREREEKQRRYEEARQRLFGPNSESSTPRASTSPARTNGRGRGRGRGGSSRGDSRPGSAAAGSMKQLFDPNYNAKADSVYLQKKESAAVDASIIREPRGPDGSGRGGIGFVNRGGRQGQ